MKIISRAGWGARAPRAHSSTTWSARREFVVHHSEGPISQTPRSIQDFHMDSRGWSDIGYNFLVNHRGEIYEGRGWLVIGAHATGHNSSGIGVCVIGRDGSDITPAAKAAVRWLYDTACHKAGRALLKRGHGQLSGNSTDCPGATLRAWVKAGMPAAGSGGTDWMEVLVNTLPTLGKGDRGEHVETVQGLLLARSHPEVKMTGVYDAGTEAAVKAVQKWGGVDADGIVGPKTWPVLLRVH
ncbi:MULTISPECIES: N-acetylmuramoyl-L-alanine amidase [Actinomadura]|uniref:N-acetylmuramoyl-L-alanine amidase n=1 Tax=Actinomadura yumaensis TaxID=111807 RepID=A0ABW2CU05_9ACTN|nr:peptidoglycan-binding domain-containing protein [Actinomadura sp. J1-007]MWK39560.1 N-acetylmuramoyl-L-alanine amidase [Actinomadura sp. J1-007]